MRDRTVTPDMVPVIKLARQMIGKAMNLVIAVLVIAVSFQGYNGWRFANQQRELITAVKARTEASEAVAAELKRLCDQLNCEQTETTQ